MSKRILVVDDDELIREVLSAALQSQGYDVSEAARLDTGLKIFSTESCDAAIVDYLLPDGTALQLIPRLKAIDPITPVLVMTGHGTIDLAVEAIKLGADHFITKPVELDVLFKLLSRALDDQRSRRRQLASTRNSARYKRDPFVGNSTAIRKLKNEVERILVSDLPILIQGETGTGKGVLAQWLHQHGPRCDDPMVDLNCAGLSRELLDSELFGHEKGSFTGAIAQKAGLLEVANRGTIFLDEIGDMDITIQPKLLKVLEEKRFRRVGGVQDRTVDVRLMAATNRDLRLLITQEKFRKDLFFRINTIPLFIPPLRERREDISLMADFFVQQLKSDLGRSQLALSEAAAAALTSYSWPGNIRELRNVLERAALLSESGTISPADLGLQAAHVAPEAYESTDNADLTLQQLERQHIIRVLKLENGSVDKAAVRLEVPRSTLYFKLKQYGITLSKVRVVGARY
ncbi:MAG: sigma-54 dependent transcriptional regulator [Candidatus Korobacteraceae bacterium]|jgi:DNA-binding NtrC family response regulator